MKSQCKRVKAGTGKVAVFFDRLMLQKLNSCVCIMRFLALGGKHPQVLDGERRAEFIAVIGQRSRQTEGQIQALACKLLLDWLTPGWGKEDPGLYGAMVKRDSPEYADWRRSVVERDSHQCQACGRGDLLHAHHVIPWAIAKSLRLDVGNGVTLCKDCHAEQHRDMRRVVWAA